MRTTRLFVIAVIAALATGVLTGCGSETTTSVETANAPSSSATITTRALPSPSDNGISALPAADILAKAKQALGAATSFRYAGRIQEADEESSVNMSFDVTLAQGKGSTGWLGWGKGKVQVVHTPAMTYMQGDAAFYTENISPAAAKKFAGKWLSMTPAQMQQDLLVPDFVTIDGVLGMFDESAESGATKTGTAVINGTPAVGLGGSGESAALWIATTGEPYPLRIEGNAEGSKTLIEFTQFSAPVEITLPPAGAAIPYSIAEMAELSD